MEVEVPYATFLDELLMGTAVPFLGAGASLCGWKRKDRWGPRRAARPPKTKELAAHLAKRMAYTTRRPCTCEMEDLARMSSYFAATLGDLDGALTTLMTHTGKPRRLHLLLAKVRPQLIIVTNYDTLVEDAFEQLAVPYDLLIYSLRRPGRLLWKKWGCPVENVAPKKVVENGRSIVFKLHGGICEHGSTGFLITEDHYVDLLSCIADATSPVPQCLKERLKASRFLFLGHGLHDWDVRVLLKLVTLPPDDRKHHWAFQKAPTSWEIRAWGTRGVQLCPIDLSTFTKKLEALL